MIEVKNMTAEKGNFTLDRLNFSIAPGEIVGYIGRNGSGKSTTIECMTGQYPIKSGDYKIFGKRFWELKEEELENIGYVDTKLSQFKGFIKFPAVCRSMKWSYKHFDRDKFTRFFERFELDKNVNTSSMSKGQYEKMILACELSHGAKILFIDEITASLDPLGRNEVFDALREYAESGGSVFITSHILSDLEKLCDRVLVIDGGKLFMDISPDELREKYAVVKVSEEVCSVIPEEAILYKKTGEYSSEVLLERSLVNESFIEHTSSLDDIIVKFLEMKKEEKGRKKA